MTCRPPPERWRAGRDRPRRPRGLHRRRAAPHQPGVSAPVGRARRPGL